MKKPKQVRRKAEKARKLTRLKAKKRFRPNPLNMTSPFSPSIDPHRKASIIDDPVCMAHLIGFVLRALDISGVPPADPDEIKPPGGVIQ